MDRTTAFKYISEKLEQIRILYQEAQEIADEHGVDFSYTGPAGYGDGGYYNHRPKPSENVDDNWEASSNWESSDYGWQPSSTSC